MTSINNNNQNTIQANNIPNIPIPNIPIPEIKLKRKYTKSADKEAELQKPGKMREKYYKKQASQVNKLHIKPIIKKCKNSRIQEADKKYIIKSLAIANHNGISHNTLAKHLKISEITLSRIYRSNIDEFNKLVNEKQNLLKSKALFKAELGLSSIKKKEFKKLNVLQISQASKNLFDIATQSDKSAEISISIGIPEHRNEVISYILEGSKAEPESVEIPK